MSEEKLVLRIKSREGDDGKRKPSSYYDVKLNDWDLGRGVTKINLDMPANEIPKLTIECFVDEIEIEGLIVDKKIAPLDVLVRDQESSLKEITTTLSKPISIQEKFDNWDQYKDEYEHVTDKLKR